MTREGLIEKIEKQGRYADALDAYRICAVYTDLFGVEYFKQTLTIEEELCVMYDKIKNYKEEEIDYLITGTKECVRCGEVKHVTEFHKRKLSKGGRKAECKACTREYQRAYLANNPKKHEEYLRKNRERARILAREKRAKLKLKKD